MKARTILFIALIVVLAVTGGILVKKSADQRTWNVEQAARKQSDDAELFKFRKLNAMTSVRQMEHNKQTEAALDANLKRLQHQ